MWEAPELSLLALWGRSRPAPELKASPGPQERPSPYASYTAYERRSDANRLHYSGITWYRDWLRFSLGSSLIFTDDISRLVRVESAPSFNVWSCLSSRSFPRAPRYTLPTYFRYCCLFVSRGELHSVLSLKLFLFQFSEL